MDLQEKTKRFIEELQTHFGRMLAFPRDVGLLLDQAHAHGMDEVFRDVIFQAKFVTRTREIMDRIGRGGEGFDKLSSEFQNSIEKSTTLTKTIVKESPEDIKQHFVKDFFGLDQASFGNFLKLLEDLSWVKNFELDGHPLPTNGSPLKRSPKNLHNQDSEKIDTFHSSGDLERIRNGASLSFVLMIVLFLVDAPISILGWGLSIIVVLMLFYIAFTTHRFLRKSDTSL